MQLIEPKAFLARLLFQFNQTGIKIREDTGERTGARLEAGD